MFRLFSGIKTHIILAALVPLTFLICAATTPYLILQNLMHQNQVSGELMNALTRTLELTILWGLIGSCLTLVSSFYLAYNTSKKMTSISTHLKNCSTEIQGSSLDFKSNSSHLLNSAHSCAELVDSSVHKLESLSEMVKLNVDHAKEAAALSSATTQSAEKGESEMLGLTKAMGEISASSKKIEEIINVIDDIAFQTNLLALNAAVEAARAGDQGKGFSVVAEAVRSLAQRSALAAKDITHLIKDSVIKIERGAKLAQSSGESLKEILTSVKKVTDINTEISTASSEQSSGIQEIHKSMNELHKHTLQASTSSGGLQLTIENILSQSSEMDSYALVLMEAVEGEKTQNNFNTQTVVTYSKKAAVENKKFTLKKTEEPSMLKKTVKKDFIKKPDKKAESQIEMEQEIETPRQRFGVSKKVEPLQKVTQGEKLKPEDIIPFDDDDTRKIGSVSNF
jgi:hypothetical protein